MELREKLIDISDSRTSQKAIKSRLENLPKDLKRRILERNDDAIIDYIESQSSQSSDTNENFKVAVLELTIQNDPETLQTILKWGATVGITPEIGEDNFHERHNPMLIACQQNFKRCMDHLYQHGYRMKIIDNECKEEDQVKKFLVFKANSNIHYLSLEFTEHVTFHNEKDPSTASTGKSLDLQELDPIRRVHKMMEDADENMEDFQGSSEMKCYYVDIKKELEIFLVSILNKCENMCEVKTILEHNPGDDDDDELDDSYNNWQMALHKGHKKLVSHPNFQQYLWRKMTGEESVHSNIPLSSLTDKIPSKGLITKFRVRRALWNLKNVPLTLLSFFFCYTGVVLGDLFREADILFVTPSAIRKRKGDKETQLDNADGCLYRTFYFFRSRLHIPLLRMIPYFAIQGTYILFLFLSIWHPMDPMKANLTDYLYSTIIMTITFVMTINFLLDDIINLFRPQHLQSRWSKLALISHLFLVVGAAIGIIYSIHDESIKLADLSGNSAVNVSMTLVSYGAGMHFLLILRWLVLLETTGPIVLCVLRVIGDALRMVSIYLVLFLAHAIAFWSLYKPFRPDPTYERQNITAKYSLVESTSGLTSQRGLLSTLFWRIIASAGPEMVNIKSNIAGDDEEAFSMEFSHLMGLVLWGIYQIIIYVLMLNLLIAVMNTSYSELWQNVNVEWKYTKSYFVASFLDPLEIFPVPFRWTYYIAKAVYKCKDSSHATKQDHSEYYGLVRRLILEIRETEIESSSYMKNNDLRVDILNEIKKMKTLD